MDRALLVKNAVSTVRTIKTYGVPVVHSTVNFINGREQPTLPELAGRRRRRVCPRLWPAHTVPDAAEMPRGTKKKRRLAKCVVWPPGPAGRVMP